MYRLVVVTVWIVTINAVYIGSPLFEWSQLLSWRIYDIWSSAYKIIVYACPVLLLLWYKMTDHDRKRQSSRQWTKQWWIYAIWIVDVMMIVVSKMLVSSPLGAEKLIFTYGYVLVVNTVVEEMLFRGWMQNKLLSRYDYRWAIVVQAVLFVIVHIPLYIFVGNPRSLMGIFIGGIVFGMMTYYSKSLLPAMILHSIHNGLGIFLVL